MSEYHIDAIIENEPISGLANWLEVHGSELRRQLRDAEPLPILNDPLAAANELIAAMPTTLDASISSSFPKLEIGREAVVDVAELKERLEHRPAVECVLGMIAVDGYYEITLFNRQLQYVSTVTCMIPGAMLEEVACNVFVLNLAARVAYHREDATRFDLRKQALPKLEGSVNDGGEGQSMLTDAEVGAIIADASSNALYPDRVSFEKKREKCISYSSGSYREFLFSPPNHLLIEDLCRFSDIIAVQAVPHADEIVWTAYDFYAAIFQQLRIGNWAQDAKKLERLEFAFWLKRQRYIINTGEVSSVDLDSLFKMVFDTIEEKF